MPCGAITRPERAPPPPPTVAALSAYTHAVEATDDLAKLAGALDYDARS
ncbi:hypothetical protein AB0C02_26075 [Micromonospora sp. NPDC048999]